MIHKNKDSGVWMESQSDNSVARHIAEKAMRGLKMDWAGDWVKRDAIISDIVNYVNRCLDEAYKQGSESDQKDTGIGKYAFSPGDKVRVLGEIPGCVHAVILGPKGSVAYCVLVVYDGRVHEDDFLEHELTLDESEDEKAE